MSEIERRLRTAPSAPALDLVALRASLAQRAAASGQLDVAYASLDSPLGTLIVFVTPRGVVRIAYPGESVDAMVEAIARRVSPRVLLAPAATDEARRQLEHYLAGGATGFSIGVDWSLVHGFAARVLRALRDVPYGDVTTYRDVAAAAGSPRAARAAGNALGANPIPIVVPCHRVVHAGGGIGGYAGGLERKRFLLRLEGALPADAG